jgi:hypothetical protein
MTMRQALDLIAITDPAQLSDEARSLPGTHPLRRVDEPQQRRLYDVGHGRRLMRSGLEALKAAADREIGHLDQGYATGDGPVHYAGKTEAGRQKLVRGFEQVNLLAQLRQLPPAHTGLPGTEPTPPAADPRRQAEAGTLTGRAHPPVHHPVPTLTGRPAARGAADPKPEQPAR